jgi:hypothetical protein
MRAGEPALAQGPRGLWTRRQPDRTSRHHDASDELWRVPCGTLDQGSRRQQTTDDKSRTLRLSSVATPRHEQRTDDGPPIYRGPSVVCRLLSVPGPEPYALPPGLGSAFGSLRAGALRSCGRLDGPGRVISGAMVPAPCRVVSVSLDIAVGRPNVNLRHGTCPTGSGSLGRHIRRIGAGCLAAYCRQRGVRSTGPRADAAVQDEFRRRPSASMGSTRQACVQATNSLTSTQEFAVSQL